MIEAPLPIYSGRGNRRRLDRLWLDQLKRFGISPLLFSAVPQHPEVLYAAIEEFNDSKFWKCHDTLEGLWLITPYPIRLFYHGLIKIAVGFHHLQRHNHRGGTSKLFQGLELLKEMPSPFLGVDVESLRSSSLKILDELHESHNKKCDQLGMFPKVILIGTQSDG